MIAQRRGENLNPELKAAAGCHAREMIVEDAQQQARLPVLQCLLHGRMHAGGTICNVLRWLQLSWPDALGGPVHCTTVDEGMISYADSC